MVSETKAICDRIKLEDVNTTNFDKHEYKELVVKACRKEDAAFLRGGMEGRSKVQDLVSENCLIKDYFKYKSLARTRDMFRIRTHMNELKANFKHDKKNIVGGVACVACGMEDESNSHVMKCDKYRDLRDGRDLKSNNDLVNFFRDVMSRREKIEKGN